MRTHGVEAIRAAHARWVKRRAYPRGRCVMERFDEYQQEAARTGGSDLRDGQTLKGMSCAGLGLTGEAGEVADIIKKVVHHGRDLDDAMETKLKKELGDVLWYAAHLCNVMGWSLSEVAALNVEKLRARYPNGFNTADSIAKRDEAGGV